MILYVAWRRFKIVMSEQTETVDIGKLIERSGVRVGTNVKTKFMKSFITKTTAEGLYMLDGDMTIEKIMTSAKFINRVGAENIIVCSGRQYAGIPIEKFCEITGAKQLLGRFMPGTLTNPSLPYYIEPKIVLISDPEVDEQALIEATNAGIPVIGLANTDNITSKLDIIIPANNRGRKALATIYWLLSRQILIEKGELKENESMKYEIENFEAKMTEEEIE
jgi:small subunit ribosomal protein S2